MNETVDLLFVYGTLKDKAAHPMARYLWRQATYLGRATFQGRLYRVAHYPAAEVSAEPNDQISGALFRLRHRGIFKHLDLYEGGDYCRQIVTVTDARGRSRRASIYLYNRTDNRGFADA